MQLETGRLRLRDVTPADAPFMLELLNSAGFIENIGDRGVRTLEDAQAYIRDRVIGSYQANGFGMWLVEAGGQAVGLAGLVKREGLDRPDVGYAFLADAWGRGYAQEAAAAVMGYARGELGLGPLAAITAPENYASMAVLRKVGFTFQGMITLPGAARESTYFTSE